MKNIHPKTVFIGVLIALCTTLFSFSTASAYVLSGETWPYGVNPLTWRSFYDTPALTTAFNSAKADWDNTATSISFSYDYWNFQVMASEYSEDDGYDGWAHRYTVNGDIVAADLWLNRYNLNGQSTNYMRGCAGHEWGHVFGLLHTTSTALMNLSRNRETIYTPKTDDVNGVNAMY